MRNIIAFHYIRMLGQIEGDSLLQIADLILG